MHFSLLSKYSHALGGFTDSSLSPHVVVSSVMKDEDVTLTSSYPPPGLIGLLGEFTKFEIILVTSTVTVI